MGNTCLSDITPQIEPGTSARVNQLDIAMVDSVATSSDLARDTCLAARCFL